MSGIDFRGRSIGCHILDKLSFHIYQLGRWWRLPSGRSFRGVEREWDYRVVSN
jgi:hypothetical protein